jgi:hypothetical protein
MKSSTFENNIHVFELEQTTVRNSIKKFNTKHILKGSVWSFERPSEC